MMKKLFLSLLFASVYLISSAEVPVVIGFQAGVSMSKLKLENDFRSESAKMHPGAAGGIFVNIGIFKEFVSIQPEIGIIQKGGTFKDYISGPYTVTEKNAYNHVSSTLMFFGGWGNDKFKVRGGVGPFYSSWISGWPGNQKIMQVEADGRVVLNETYKIDLKRGGDSYDSRNEFGIAAGAGASIFPKGGKHAIIVDFRYILGLTDTYYYEEGAPTNSPNGKNNVMTLGVGYGYKIQ